MFSLHSAQVAHKARAYPGFYLYKQPGVFLLPLDGMLVHCRITPSSKFNGTHFYTWVERGTVSVKCLAQERNALTIRPWRLPHHGNKERKILFMSCSMVTAM